MRDLFLFSHLVDVRDDVFSFHVAERESSHVGFFAQDDAWSAYSVTRAFRSDNNRVLLDLGYVSFDTLVATFENLNGIAEGVIKGNGSHLSY